MVNLPTHKQILNWWKDNVDGKTDIFMLDNYDGKYCFSCGKPSKLYNLERAHIIGKQFGGSNEPSNFLLICKDCHKKIPDINNRELIIEWATSQKNWLHQKREKWESIFKSQGYDKDSLLNIYKFVIENNIINKLYNSEELGFHFAVGIKDETLVYSIINEYKNSELSDGP